MTRKGSAERQGSVERQPKPAARAAHLWVESSTTSEKTTIARNMSSMCSFFAGLYACL